MPPKKRSARPRADSPKSGLRPQLFPAESKSAEAVTVAWVLTLMSTLAAEALGVLTRALAVSYGPAPQFQVLSGTFLLVAVIAGLVTLVLTIVTVKVRRVPPPRPLVTLAIVSGVVPWITIGLLLWR